MRIATGHTHTQGAAGLGDAAMVARLLDGGADIEEKDWVGTSAHEHTQAHTETQAHNGRSRARTGITHDSTLTHSIA